MVSIQSSYTSPLKFRCSSSSRNLVSCTLLTSCLCSLNYLSYGDVIYGISYLYSFNCLSYGNVIRGTPYLYSFNCLSCGDVIYGTFVVYLITYTTIGITRTIVGITNGSTPPFIILCALAYVLSYSLFILESKALPSSTLFFFLKALLGESIIAFFLFSNVVYISSLVF